MASRLKFYRNGSTSYWTTMTTTSTSSEEDEVSPIKHTYEKFLVRRHSRSDESIKEEHMAYKRKG
ncbi:unnamed protein product, partial [Sphenostylis stenocarpa]